MMVQLIMNEFSIKKKEIQRERERIERVGVWKERESNRVERDRNKRRSRDRNKRRSRDRNKRRSRDKNPPMKKKVKEKK
jgi:hypothetical protein